ncbi:aminopeptidase N C-terminal domain-containing protein, partial [Acinetobacter baumannii]
REAGRTAIGGAFAAVLADTSLDDLMRGELVILPGEGYLAEQIAGVDPVALRAEWLALHDRTSAVPFGLDAAARGARKLKTQALVYL